MYIQCNKPVSFVSRTLATFSVREEDVGKIIEAPDWIKDTFLFEALGDDIRVYKEPEAPVAVKEPEPPENPIEEAKEEEKPKTTSRKKKGEASDI